MSQVFEKASLEVYKVDPETGKAKRIRSLANLKDGLEETTVLNLAQALDDLSADQMDHAIVVTKNRYVAE